jgi:crossover junction endodeoxyribonuclease RuvC
MKILGIDISSRSTGLGLIEDDKLLEYSKINPTGTMSSTAKMYLFFVELDKLISKYSPDYIAVEDVIQVASVSVTKLLARFNGIALISAYKYNKKDPRLFVPSEWKKIIGLTGTVRKCETQLFVCNKYKLLDDKKIKQYSEKINEIFTSKDEQLEEKKKSLELLKKQKRKIKNETELNIVNEEIEKLSSEITKLKKDSKILTDKLFDDLSMEIYVETGINEDIADAIGISLAYQIELK